MNKRHGGIFAITHSDLSKKIGVSRVRITQMLNNPDSGQNRARLMAALEKMGLNEEAAKRFINGQNQTQ